MPGAANAIIHQINELTEKLKTEKDPAEIARIQEVIKNLKESLPGK